GLKCLVKPRVGRTRFVLGVDAIFGLPVQYNNADTTVNGSVRIIFNQTDRRRQTQYLLDLAFKHPAGDQFLARRVGPVSRKLPVTVEPFTRGILKGICVTRNGY